MKTFLVTGNFDGEIQDFFQHFFGGGGKERGRVSSGEGEGMNPSASPQGRGDQVICASSSR